MPLFFVRLLCMLADISVRVLYILGDRMGPKGGSAIVWNQPVVGK